MKLRNDLGIRACLLATSLFAGAHLASAQINVNTERYDAARTGANLNETQLTTANVNVNQFGKLWSYTVTGSVQAQPLYVQGVNIAGQPHNVLFVVTMNDMVYAFDADSNATLWSLNIATQVAGGTPVPITDIVPANLNIVGNVGIESTPYIDPATNTMYLVARTKEPGTACGTINGNYCQRLHALDITSGAEKFGGPALIQGSVSGAGNGSVGGTLTFDPKIHNQRSSLAIANGQLFMSWSSHEDDNPYHGWIMSYNAATLQQTGIWCSSPDGFQAGIWMAGRAPAVDAGGNVYYMVGNGDWNGTRNFGESMLRFGSTGGLALQDWFTPDSWPALNSGDADYGSSGPLLIPGTDLVVGGGKSSIFYLIHTGSLGHEHTGNSQIVQSLPVNGGEIHGGPVYWNRSGGLGPWLYVWADGADVIKAYHFNGASFDTGSVSEGTIASPAGESGGVLTLSANGSTAGTGIIWSSMPLADNADHGVHQGVLRALNADDLTKELWSSQQNAARDNTGNWPKYSPPVVVNGHVYMASFPGDGISTTAINVYGLLSTTPDFGIAVDPGSLGVNPGGSVNYTIDTSALNGYTGLVDFGLTGLPAGATATWSSTTTTAEGGALLTITAGLGTPLGSYTLTVTGTSGALTHSATTILIVTTATPGSGAISINFVGRDTPMSAAEVAGVVPKANWNQANNAGGSIPALVDENAMTTGASATWNADGVWSLPGPNTAGDFDMMNGYLDTLGDNTVVTVAGLPSNGTGYDIYVYADGDNPGATRTGTYQLTGGGIGPSTTNLTDVANTDFSGTYVQANNSSGNYVKFSIATTGFTLTAIPGAASDGVQRAPVNGIQIIPRLVALDYSFSASPASQVVMPGNSTNYNVNVTGLNGFTGAVTFSVSGLPAGASATFTPASINGTGSSTLTVFTTSSTPAGTSTLTISSSSGMLAHTASVTLVVSASPVPVAQIAPTAVAFGNQVEGTTSAARMVTLSNSGNAALNISSMSIGGTGGTNFAPTNNCGASLAAGSSCTISVTFKPGLTGNLTAQLSVSDNATGSPQTVNLFGTGVASTPAVRIAPSSLSFGGLVVGSNSAAQMVTVTNSGSVMFNIARITPSGDFSQTNDCGSGLAPGANCTIGVVFKPTEAGNLAGTLLIEDAAGSHQTNLSGTGMDFSVAASPNAGEVKAGHSMTFEAMVSPAGGFHDAVSLTCSGAPANATCEVTPSSVTLSGATASSATIAIGTKKRSFVWPMPPGIPPAALEVMEYLLAFGILLLWATQRKQRVSLLALSAVAVFAIATAGCASVVVPGDGSSSLNGTPAGTYAITVTATSGNLTRTTTYSLTVK
jgi:Abnormal spindle-like microcephaly-assoc'd, ASPM-SPD-2-Hydin/PQQ-like domain